MSENNTKLLLGDCLEVLRTMPDNSVDSVVTDPPYGLSTEPDIAKVMQHWIDDTDYMHTSKGFMGKTWDSFVPGPKYWRECFRVLKPGGHMLVFAGTRTQDLMGIALRFAGFEIRDTLTWLYGSGFPKSLDISKAIDKAAGAERAVLGPQVYGDGHIQNNGGNHNRSAYGTFAGDVEQNTIMATAPATPEAKQWQGFGTALKPASEPILLVRKPISEKTVAANVLKWGTGGINIDATRIGTTKRNPGFTNGRPGSMFQPGDAGQVDSLGRFPANLLLDEESAKALDAQSGMLKAGVAIRSRSGGKNCHSSQDKPPMDDMGYGDSGGASRFFYCAKSSSREKNAGLEGMPVKQTIGGGGTYNEEAGRKYGSIKAAGHNFHPTVKPISLMRYLCRLITPPGGTILDPFMGSGSTGCAAKQEGFSFIGIEREAEYLAIAERRIAHAAP